MSFDIFTQSSDEPLRGFIDQTKVKVIADKLCSKRKELEERIKSCTETERDILLLELLEKQNDMRTFGVSEIDYQAYLARTVTTTN